MRFLAALGLAAVIPAQSVLVYDNGSFVTGTGAAGPISEAQTTAPYSLNTIGFNVNNVANVRQTDDFTVNTGMVITDVEVFFYNTGATTPTASGVFLSIFDANPVTGTPNQLITGAGATTNLFTTSGFTVANTLTGIYRVTSTGLTLTNRNIQSVRVTLPTPLVLGPGTYYLQYSIAATTTPFFAPVTTLHKYNTGNAQQYTAGTYAALQQNTVIGGVATNIPGAFQGVPFRLYGPSGSALPGAITNLNGGCSTPTLNVAGSPNVGGHVHASMTNITANPAQIRQLIVGLTNPGIPLPGCACVSLASLDLLVGFASDASNPNLPLNPSAPPATPFGWELDIPLTAALSGFTFYLQGLVLDFGAPTACNFAGIPLELTNGYEVRLNIN